MGRWPAEQCMEHANASGGFKVLAQPEPSDAQMGEWEQRTAQSM